MYKLDWCDHLFFAGRPKQEHKAKRPLPVPRNIYNKKVAVEETLAVPLPVLRAEPQYHPVICRSCGKTASHNRYEFNNDKYGICPYCSTGVELA